MNPNLSIIVMASFLASCATQVDYIANSSGRQSRPANCDIAVYLPGTPLNKPYEIIGSLSIGDTGFTIDCSRETIFKQARERGCKAGADAILINEVKEPDWISLCFRLNATMLTFTSSTKAASPLETPRLSKKPADAATIDAGNNPPKPVSPPSGHRWKKPK